MKTIKTILAVIVACLVSSILGAIMIYIEFGISKGILQTTKSNIVGWLIFIMVFLFCSACCVFIGYLSVYITTKIFKSVKTLSVVRWYVVVSVLVWTIQVGSLLYRGNFVLYDCLSGAVATFLMFVGAWQRYKDKR